MTWALHDHQPRRPAARAPLERVRAYWQLRAPSGRTLTCGLFRTEAGLEVRAGYGDDEPVRTELVPTEATGDVLATKWHEVAVATGRFTELPGA